MSNKIWKQMWRQNDIPFHQPACSSVLKNYLSSCRLRPGDKVLVPLCGKSHDMDLLADSGYQVMGVELSHIAIAAYFEARKVNPSRSKKGAFTLWRHKNTEIWCGDIFNLTVGHLRDIKLMYDCTSLTAFAPSERFRYVSHFQELLPIATEILLLTVETPEAGDNSHKAIDGELVELYGRDYEISLLYGEPCLKADPQSPQTAITMMEEKLYRLNQKLPCQ